METRNAIGMLLLIIFFSAFGWLIFAPDKKSITFFIVPFILIFVFFVLLSSMTLLGRRQGKKAFEELTNQYGLTPQQTIDDTISQGITHVLTNSFNIIGITKYDTIYTRDTPRGKITIFDVHYKGPGRR